MFYACLDGFVGVLLPDEQPPFGSTLLEEADAIALYPEELKSYAPMGLVATIEDGVIVSLELPESSLSALQADFDAEKRLAKEDAYLQAFDALQARKAVISLSTFQCIVEPGGGGDKEGAYIVARRYFPVGGSWALLNSPLTKGAGGTEYAQALYSSSLTLEEVEEKEKVARQYCIQL